MEVGQIIGKKIRLNQRRRRGGGSALANVRGFSLANGLNILTSSASFSLSVCSFRSTGFNSICGVQCTVSYTGLCKGTPTLSTLLFHFFALVVSFTLSPVCGNTKQNFLLIQ